MLNAYYLEKEAGQRMAEWDRRLREAELIRALARTPANRWRRWASAAGDLLIALGQGLKTRVALDCEETAQVWQRSAGRGSA
jgi:hypothetical protein